MKTLGDVPNASNLRIVSPAEAGVVLDKTIVEKGRDET